MFTTLCRTCCIVLALAPIARSAPATEPATREKPVPHEKPAPREKMGLAVLDAKKLITSVGWAQEKQKDHDAVAAVIDRELKVFQQNLESVVESERKKISVAADLTISQIEQLNRSELDKLPLNQQQREELILVISRSNQLMQQARNVALTVMQKRETEVDTLLTEAARPAVRRVAQQKGITAIALTTSLFYSDESIDVTDAVIDEIIRNPPPHMFPGMPGLNLPRITLNDVQGNGEQPTSRPSR